MLRHLRWFTVVAFAGSTLLAMQARAEDGLRGARVAAGELAASGALLVAGPHGLTLSFEYGSKLRAEPGTTFRFGKQMKLPMGAGPDPMVPARVLTLESGSVTAELPVTKRFALLMNGPHKLRAILSSGEVTMIASEARATVAVHRGNPLVTLSDKWRHLPADSMQNVSMDRPLGWKSELPGAPGTPVLSRSLLIEGEGAEASTMLAWPAMAHVAAYDLTLVGADGVLAREIRTGEPRTMLSSLPPGNYQLSVRAVDESGLHGPASGSVALNVVGLDIPETASRGAEGTVRLQPGQRVGLKGADGLEVGYLGFDNFLPAPKTLGLVARRPISMLLRHPTSGETLKLNLEPMLVKAKIGFAEHPESWPTEGLQVTVKLVDAEGHPVPDNYPVSCRVSVNVALAHPKWERQGSTLRATLDQPDGFGPWMVRVDVMDESGGSIGMDFSEVAYRRGPEPAASVRRVSARR